MIVYLARDIPQFVMYCVNGKPRSSLFIESTDSMIILAISISPDASHRMYYFLLTIIITSVIQRINGASLKETLGSTAKSGVQTAVSTTSGRY